MQSRRLAEAPGAWGPKPRSSDDLQLPWIADYIGKLRQVRTILHNLRTLGCGFTVQYTMSCAGITKVFVWVEIVIFLCLFCVTCPMTTRVGTL